MLADRFASLMSRSRSLGLSLAIAVAAGLAVIQIGMLVHVNNREQADLKASAQQRAETALNMLSAVHTNAMRNRRSTKDGDGAIATLNGTMAQFSSSRDQVTLWMVMGPKIIAFQTANKSDEIEGPRDAVDQRAVDSGTAQETFGDDSLRSVRPVLFGQGLATRASCGGCHEALMGIKPGEVMGAYSAKVDLREHSAALAARLRTEAGLTIAAICALVAMVMGMASILILRPIDRMRRAATAFAAADYDVEIGETERRDEIGALARALTFFRDRMIDRQRLENELSQQQSHSDQAQRDSDRVRQLAQSKAAERDAQQHAMLQLSERFEQSVAIIVDAVHTAAVGLAQAADQMVVAAEGASVEADTIAGASGQANDNVGRVARATEELSNSIEMIAEQVLRQSELTGLANQRSEEGAATVQRLSTKAENIRGILSLVQNVAGQTNLLALNASIESARAGVAGRGFAVVANEVKALANQTSASLEDIDAIVQSVRAEVDETVGSITTVARSLGEVRGIAASLAASVSQQKLVASEISEHAATAADGTSLVNRSIVNLAAISRQAGEMARDVKQMSLSLSSQADTLNGAASSFISHLRDDGEQRVAQG